MTLVSLTGEALPSALHKNQKTHHPDRVMKRRQLLSNMLQGLQENWGKDSGEDPLGATKANAVAIDRHYDERWRQECSMANASQEAVDADPEAMAKWMAEQRETKAKMERWNTPLHKLHDLEEFQFRLVGESKEGTMWLSSHIALCVAENGVVHGYMRDSKVATHDPQYWPPLLEQGRIGRGVYQLFTAIDYTPHELFALLGALRVDKVTFPTERTMNEARQSMDGTPAK